MGPLSIFMLWENPWTGLNSPWSHTSASSLIIAKTITNVIYWSRSSSWRFVAREGGANAFTEIAVIANEKKQWFQTFLTLPAGIPSHDTFNRVLARVSPQALQRCFISWVQATFPHLDEQQIALDGKETHHSMDPTNDYANLRMISAWAVDQGIVLRQVAVEDTSNEITALPAVLELVDVTDCDITADALHCQTNTVQTIRAADAHYTIAVKANQKTLYHDIRTTFTTLRADDKQSIATYETVEKGHGRIETRRYWLTDDLSHLSTRDAWKDLQSIGMVESERQIGAQVSHKVIVHDSVG
jgi:predicted transposase YbfD/YdcC